MDVSAFLGQLKDFPWYRDQVVHREGIPARATTYADLERPLNPDLQRSLDSRHHLALFPSGGCHRLLQEWRERHRSHAIGQREEPLLSPAYAGRADG